MILLLNHPEVAERTCEDCQRWVYDDDGRLVVDRGTGQPKLRQPGKTPCAACPKCQWSDVKTPAEGQKAELTERNRAALDAYYMRRAAGGSVGPTYRRKFGIIHRIMAEHDRLLRRRELTLWLTGK